MPQIDLEQLIADVQEHLDFDPRFWDQQSGSMEWDGVRVFFSKGDDWIILHVANVEVEVARP
jgi:hypothetical protein